MLLATKIIMASFRHKAIRDVATYQAFAAQCIDPNEIDFGIIKINWEITEKW